MKRATPITPIVAATIAAGFLVIGLPAGCAMFDKDPPVITVLSHRDGDTVPERFVLKGSAADPSGVQSVEVRIDEAPDFAPAQGTDQWSTLLYPGPGSHILTIRARDYIGNERYGYMNLHVQAESE